MDTPNPYVTAVAGLVIVSLIYSVFSRRTRQPPGPRQLPIIGNAHQLPVQSPWKTYSEWTKTYGDLIFLNIMGQPTLLVSSPKVASDLMEKRATIYSDRPYMEMANLCGYYNQFVLQSYGENWRQQRKYMAQDFTQSSVHRFYSLIETNARVLVSNLLIDSASLQSELRLRLGSIILRITYGYRVQKADDPFLVGGLTALGNFSKVTTPGAFLVDSIPSLKYLRRWMPGSGFLKTADEYYKVLWHAAWDPYSWCKENIDTGKSLMPNICGEIIQKGGLSKEDENRLAWGSFTTFEGGLDTSISTALTFFMCMILNPDVQMKAQGELDKVIGSDRLPTIKDRDDLPYMRSVIAEVYRFAPAIPLGVPHASTKDDVYEGYFLPKGTWVIPNIWHMLHDPDVYSDPLTFNPDRFNGDDVKMERVKDFVFGFGRRFCPGRYFSGGSFFSIAATALATCNILPGFDKDGNKVFPKIAYTNGTIIFPETFPIRLEARSPEAKRLLEEACEEFESVIQLDF